MTTYTDMTLQEAIHSCNGFDEIAIRKAFGNDLMAMDEDSTDSLRAVAFVIFRRKGQDDAVALESARSLTIGVLTQEFFEPEPECGSCRHPESVHGRDGCAVEKAGEPCGCADFIDPEDETPAGKDDASPEAATSV